ncbi:FAD-binding oxidoreductase [Hufsiella ginkgonis]|uniref:FAD-binding protein n=1 Tax=Hufsiella ginkgonis TaxID=2695274 RepID=A0A7K1XST6_9SPHI|nr:FAD-linked oxidase C-terminal domain-containing protein [Hufsiella ginkgonis]MXV13819.1 FAD-binding protein [Hufsiella ginkgonis]
MIPFSPITEDILAEITAIAGPGYVLCGREELEPFAHDETEDLRFFPEVVVRPADTAQVSALLRLCTKHRVPVTPRGAGTGLSGGALAVNGGLMLSTDRLNKIISIDTQNLQALVEPGVITEVFMNEVAGYGLLYPVDPSSKGSCFLGGNVAHGSGGPRAVKYGTVREYVLNLEIVLPDGEVTWTGANTLKYASGYNLTQLMVGSEGTLAVITKIVLKLIARPALNVLMMASFLSNEQACAAVSGIFRAGILPSALEFMERKGIEWVKVFDHISFPLKPGDQAFLLIELDGNDSGVLFGESEKINEVLELHGCTDVLFADSSVQKEELWKIRRTMPLSVKSNSIYKEEDTVVPRAGLPQLINGVKEIGNKYGFESVCYGHAGDGNLHINIIRGGMSEDAWNTKLKAGIREIFELTVSLGGTISGEHGIGYVQKEYMPLKYSATHLALMKGIKAVFDPQGILNPGKIF